MATKVLRDSDLANKLRSATASGEALVEADGHRFLVIRVPQVMELDDPDEMAMALDVTTSRFLNQWRNPLYNTALSSKPLVAQGVSLYAIS